MTSLSSATPATATVSEPESAPLPVSLCMGFAIGTVGVSIMLNTVTTYFPAFMATVLGQSTAIAGLLLTLSKLYDVVADIIIGSLSDRTKSRWGRRRPFLAIGGVVSAASLLMIFLPPELNDKQTILYMAAALIVYSTGYSLFNVPYIAMPAEMSSDHYQRTRLMSFRTAFVAAGQLISIGGAAALVKLGGGGMNGYTLMGATLAGVVFLAMIGSFFGTAKARSVAPVALDHSTVAEKLRLLWENRPLVFLITAKLMQYIAVASTVSTNLLFKLNVLQIGYEGQFQYSVASNLATALSMPLWLRLGRAHGKKRCYMVATTGFALVSLSWLLTGAGISLATLITIAIFSGITSGGMLLMSISMLPDVMAYDRIRTGMRREGVYSSIYAIVEKLGFALGVVIIGTLLAWGGYVPTMGGALTEQPPEAIFWMYATNTVIPALLVMGSVIAISRYNLDERQLGAMQAERDRQG